MTTPSIAIVILNWNGKKWLQKFLTNVLENSAQAKIFVADNASTDDSVSFLQQHFPQVEIIRNPDNFGFAKGYNEALQKVTADYYVLLNSDIEVEKNWLLPMISFMESHPDVAACMPKILDYHQRDKFEYAGACGGFIDTLGYPFCRGRIFEETEKDIGQYNNEREIFWATGACLFIRSKIFHVVNGFDDDFFAHMEEIDLCWRIKNKGYKIFVIPESKVYHVGGGTLKKTNPTKTYLNFRNSLITLTKNDFSKIVFLKVILRLILDGFAGIKFMLSGMPKHCWAIVRSHWSFFLGLEKTLRKRRQQKKSIGFPYSTKPTLKKSIVWKYYATGIRRFSEIDSEIN